MTTPLPALTGRILAAGKNYLAHIAAMADGQAPARPLIFSKPPAALRQAGEWLWAPPGCDELHPEAELVVLLGDRLRAAQPDEAAAAVAGYAAGLDMTDRGLQREIKAAGHPWDLSKSFDGSAGLGPLIAAEQAGPWEDLVVRLSDAEGTLLQEARPREMILGVPELLAYLSERFTLEPGDLVYTGAPAGTLPVQAGDELVLELIGHTRTTFSVRPER